MVCHCSLEQAGASKKDDHRWYCCECGDGPYGAWQQICMICNHGAPSSGTVASSQSFHMEVEIHQREANQPDSLLGADSSLFPTKTPELAFLSRDYKAQGNVNKHVQDVTSSSFYQTTMKELEEVSKPASDQNKTAVMLDESSSATSTVSSTISVGDSKDGSSTEYSDTDVVDAPVLHDYLRNRAQSLVNHLTKNLHFEFDFESKIVKCTHGQNTDSSNSLSQPLEIASTQGLGDAKSSQKKRENEEDENHRDRKKLQAKRQRVESAVESSPLACPFFKRNSRLCTRYRSCSERGWTEIHRLREHIDRCHRVYQCQRCYVAFLQAEKLKEHSRRLIPCPLQNEIQVFGINEKRFPLIHARLRRGTQEEKWKELYQRIFPEISPESIPCPYFDGRPPETVDDGYHTDVSDGEEFYQRLKEGLPGRTLCLLREIYQEELTIAYHEGGERLQGLINTKDFEKKLRGCMEHALGEFRSHFLSPRSTTGNLKTSNNLRSNVSSGRSGQTKQPPVDSGDFRDGGGGPSSSTCVNSTSLHHNNYNIEVDLGPNFPIEEAFHDYNFDVFKFPIPELASKDNPEGLTQSERDMIADNLTLEFPGLPGLIQTQTPQIHLTAPPPTRRDDYKNEEQARAAAAALRTEDDDQDDDLLVRFLRDEFDS